MQKQSGRSLAHSGRGPLSAPVIIFLRRVACLSCPAVPHQRRRHCSSPAEPSGNRGGSPSRLFRRYLGPQPRSATGLQASPLRDGSTVAERAHHAGAVPLARLLTRLSVSAPSGSSDTRHGDRWLAARMAGVTVFMLEWSEAHFIDSLINSSVGENYVIDLLKYDKKPSVMVLNHADVHNALPAHHERGRGRRRRVPREQVRDPATPVPLQGGHVPQRCRASVLKRLQPPSSTKHWRCAAAGSTRDSSAETAALFAEPSAGAFASRRCLHTLAAHRQFEGRGGHRSGRAEARRRGTDARAVRSTDARAAAALPRRPPLLLWWRGDSRLAWTSFRRHDSLPPTTTGARLLRHALIIYYFARTSRLQCCADHIIFYHKLNHYVGSSNLPARSGLVYSGLGQQG